MPRTLLLSFILALLFAHGLHAEESAKPEGKEVTVAGKLKEKSKDAKEGVVATLEIAANEASGEKARTLNVIAKGGVAKLVEEILKEVADAKALVTITGIESGGDITVTKQIKVLKKVGANDPGNGR
jgi:hypothetical protein